MIAYTLTHKAISKGGIVTILCQTTCPNPPKPQPPIILLWEACAQLMPPAG